MIKIEILNPDDISQHDPTALSILMTELGGREIDLSYDDVVKIVSDTTTVVARLVNDDKSIVGAGCVVHMHLLQGYRHLIESVVVLPQYRGYGLGRKIVDQLIDEARKFGDGNINLTCRPGRKHAIILYREMGFEKIDTDVYRLHL